jgi:uncharacterized protein YerC
MRGYKETIMAMLDAGYSYREIAEATGCSKSTISFHSRKSGRPSKVTGTSWTAYNWEEVQQYYDEGHSYRECLKHFGMSSTAWSKAKYAGKIVARHDVLPLHEILTEKSSHARKHVKSRLLHTNTLRNACYICGISEWLGKPLSLELDHINGIGDDHRLENLRMLCPNCHSQTETFKGRNKRSYKAKIAASNQKLSTE